jgi:hypothetical protein
MFVMGVIAIIFGVISLVKRDWIWALTRMGNERSGLASERTELWENGTLIGGVIAIVLGVIAILLEAPR